jgi:hypothetical protein
VALAEHFPKDIYINLRPPKLYAKAGFLLLRAMSGKTHQFLPEALREGGLFVFHTSVNCTFFC